MDIEKQLLIILAEIERYNLMYEDLRQDILIEEQIHRCKRTPFIVMSMDESINLDKMKSILENYKSHIENLKECAIYFNTAK